MDYLTGEEEEGTTCSSVRMSAKLREDKSLSTSEGPQNISGSMESLASATDVGCSRILGDIQAGLQADINAAKVILIA